MNNFKTYFENKEQHNTVVYVLQSSRNFEEIKVVQLKGDLDIVDRWEFLGSHNNKKSFEDCIRPLKMMLGIYVLRQEGLRKELLTIASADSKASKARVDSIIEAIYNRISQAFEPYKDYPGIWRVVNASPTTHLKDAQDIAMGVEVDAEYVRTLGMRSTFDDTQDNIIDW